MVSVRTLVTLKRGGEYHPPGSEFHDFDEEEVADLGKYVERIASPAPPVETDVAPETPSPAEVVDVDDDGEGSRVEQIARAIDLLEPTDFTRSGRPTIPALTGVLGFKPTPDEITAALAQREAEGL